MIEHVPSWWPMASYALGFVMGATSGARFAFYREFLRRLRYENTNRPSGPPPLKFRPSEPDPPERFIRMDEGPIARSTNDSGPTTPKPAIIPKGQRPGVAGVDPMSTP